MEKEIEKLQEAWSDIDYLLNSEGVCITEGQAALLDSLADRIKLTLDSITLVTPLQILKN